jgi:hypothetical protein
MIAKVSQSLAVSAGTEHREEVSSGKGHGIAHMINFSLRCADGHEFEGWFRDGATYDKQAKSGKVSCPDCGSTKVEKAPMAPRLAKSSSKPEMSLAEMRKALLALRKHVEANCDYVGPRFAEEARKIHYGEVERRSIYGESTLDEAKELSEEGIAFGRVPWISNGDA